MFEGHRFGILGAFHYSELLYGKIRADHIRKGNDNEPYGPYDKNPNRGEGKRKQKSSQTMPERWGGL